MSFLSPVYTILSPRTVVMLMVTGRKDLHMMAELYSRRIQEAQLSQRDENHNGIVLGVHAMIQHSCQMPSLYSVYTNLFIIISLTAQCKCQACKKTRTLLGACNIFFVSLP